MPERKKISSGRSSQMLDRQLSRTATLISQSHRLKAILLLWAPGARLIFPCCLQDFFEGQHFRFRDKQTGTKVSACLVAITVGGMNHRLRLHFEIEPETRHTVSCPGVQRCFAVLSDDFCSLPNIQVAGPIFIDVSVGLVRFHPDTSQNPARDCKTFVTEPGRGFQVHTCDQADGFYEGK